MLLTYVNSLGALEVQVEVGRGAGVQVRHAARHSNGHCRRVGAKVAQACKAAASEFEPTGACAMFAPACCLPAQSRAQQATTLLTQAFQLGLKAELLRLYSAAQHVASRSAGECQPVGCTHPSAAAWVPAACCRRGAAA